MCIPRSRVRPDRRRAGRVPLLHLGLTQERSARRPDRRFRRRTGRAFANGGELRSGESASEVVPVTFETVVTETGMLQLWCVARDGRRWKLEFNVRERVHAMNIGIDLGTTNSALAYHRSARGRGSRFSADPHLRNSAACARRDAWSRSGRCRRSCSSKTASPSACTRASRARSCRHAGALGEIVAVESGCGPHREDPAVGRAGDRPRASPVEVSVAISSRKFREEWESAQGRPARRAGHRPHRARVVRRRGARADRRRPRARPASTKLTLLEEPAAAFYSWIANNLAQSQKKLFDGQMVLVCDVGGGTSDFSLIRVSREGDLVEVHAHRRRQAPAARRRQSRSDARPGWSKPSSARSSRSASAAVCGGSARRPRSGCSTIRI